MTEDLVHVIDPKAEELPLEDDDSSPKVGRWYWVKRDPEDEETSRRMMCLIHIGSNFVRLQEVITERTLRVHFDHFWQKCEVIQNPDAIIQRNVERCQADVRGLMGKVQDITRRLAIVPDSGSLTQGEGAEETSATALALHNDPPIEEYKGALIRAKDEELPALFNQIRSANELTSSWMSAQLIPMEAQAKALEPAIKAIKRRIFSVQLYAGLTEEIEQIKEGDPASVTTKIHLFQRRLYMDEECLAQYEVGGTTFKTLGDFDRWLAKPSIYERLLPFPRSIVAFRVRRHSRMLDQADYDDFLAFFSELKRSESDKKTFLYIRNGDQIFRLETDIEFGSELFSDMDYDKFRGGSAWAHVSSGRVIELISNDEYQDLQERKRKSLEEWHRKKIQEDGEHIDPEHEVNMELNSYFSDYHPFSPESVYFDDIARYVKDQADDHNRLVLVLQGLLDRSPVLHPHPPWKLWDGGGFQQALELVYDNARAIPETEAPPNFEEYRKACNALIRVGSVTIGQDPFWAEQEAEKENNKHDHGDRRYRSQSQFRPYGNPGPGKLAYVAKFSKKSGTCIFEWSRKRRAKAFDEDTPSSDLLRCTLTVPIKVLFNVSAYKPGDIKRFFNDPRTRQNYLRWAPLLIAAEEFHAGIRKAAIYDKVPPRKSTSYEGRMAYQRRKRQKALLGQAVRLKRQVEIQSGVTYEKGSLWRVDMIWQAALEVHGILPNGEKDPVYRGIRGLREYDLELDLSIPKPEKKGHAPPEEAQDDEDQEDDQEEDTSTEEEEDDN